MAEYQPLRLSRESSEDEEEKVYKAAARESSHKSRWTISQRIKTLFLLISALLNIALVVLFVFGPHRQAPTVEKSAFAGLSRTIARQWGPNNAINETEQDALWAATKYDRGNIALSDTYAHSMGLPRAQRFPWDDEKGVYLINAYHNLHCVKTLRTALVEFRDGTRQSSPWAHVVHCLLVLRDEIMCDADDTPRYTGFQPNRKSGLGQVRMCRDWTQLEKWADENSACWRHIGDSFGEDVRELDRYRFCPEGSPYKEMSETLWLKDDWWMKYKDEESV
ncbi:hypothetical protein DPV78_012031 [Talaromyces pinophilus]|nr:hypothetical protein DPV78_012031 [Talaromyces pinophilus]